MSKQKIVIVGGGFGGVKAALNLVNNPELDVTLVCPNDNFRYYPSIFKIAVGKSRLVASIPLREIFKDTNLHILKDNVVSIDRKTKTLVTAKNLSVAYDKVIFALGAITNYFSIPGMEEFSFNIKSEDGAEKFKNHIHDQLLKTKEPELNYVIVGGGPTGIELAGALDQYLKTVLEKHKITDSKYHIDLIEAKPYLMPRMTKKIGDRFESRLKKLGIRVYTNATVQGEDANELIVNNKPIRTHTVVWTAGIANNPFYKQNDFVLMKNGLVAVDMYLQAEPNIFVIGDNANTPFSGMAQTALNDADFVSTNILRSLREAKLHPYKPKRPFSVVPVGANWAGLNWGKINFYGFIASLIREVADLRGFSDIEPIPKALRQLVRENESYETCKICKTT